MSDGSRRQAPEDFNNPFSSLGRELKGKKKAGAKAQAAVTPAGPKAPQVKQPQAVQQDFTADDADAAAMFLAAVGHTQPRQRVPAGRASDQGMAELLAEAEKKRNSTAKQGRTREPGNSDTTGKEQKADSMPRSVVPATSSDAEQTRIEEVQLSPDEADSFAKAMQGVKPVDPNKGRALTPPAPPSPIRHKSAERDYLAEFAEGKYEFALEYTEEFFEGHVMGLDPLVVVKLRAGQYSPEAHIDLHGMNAEQALQALLGFVRAAYNQGRRNLIVVTGRGKNSPGGQSVLRQHLRDWLTKDPLKRVILAFCTAQPKDGGAGAFYVLLRKYKKNQGKIRWDHNPWEERPLI